MNLISTRYAKSIIFSCVSIIMALFPSPAVYAQITSPYDAGYASGYARSCGFYEFAEGIRDDARRLAAYREFRGTRPFEWDASDFQAGMAEGFNQFKTSDDCRISYHRLRADAINFRNYVNSITVW